VDEGEDSTTEKDHAPVQTIRKSNKDKPPKKLMLNPPK